MPLAPTARNAATVINDSTFVDKEPIPSWNKKNTLSVAHWVTYTRREFFLHATVKLLRVYIAFPFVRHCLFSIHFYTV